jgi:hypothetical protein
MAGNGRITACDVATIVDSVLQQWPTLHCSMEKQKFCFFVFLLDSFKTFRQTFIRVKKKEKNKEIEKEKKKGSFETCSRVSTLLVGRM